MTDVESIVAKIKGIFLNPVKTFQESRDDPQGMIITYFAAILLVNSLLHTIVIYLQAGSYMGGLSPWGPGGVFFIFVFAVLSSLVMSALFVLWLHLWVYILGGRKGLIQTAKAFVYGVTPGFLLGWIPDIGIIFLIWSIVLGVLGVRELHEISTARAAVALVIAIVIPLIFLLFVSLYLISHLNAIPAVAYTP
ncbi:Yip1 family protein [Methanolacinia paynteri]|uniref:Yip1 family protein n=1 Tax=Methanolacinia paynteri TaxID=230356 RepID=UPI00064EDC3F|nr:Yip1 family protein [Methanolacinia paynteri]